jgi:hypothetical protein
VELVYKLTPNDLVALSDHRHGTSKTLRRTTLRASILSPLVFAVGGALFWLMTGDLVLPTAFLVAGVLLFLLLPRRLRQQRRRIIEKVYGEGKNLSLFEPQTLRIEHDALASENIASTSRTKWEYIERIDVTEDRTFVYLNVLVAHVIPRHGVLRGDYEFFVDEIQRRWRQATSDNAADVWLHT